MLESPPSPPLARTAEPSTLPADAEAARRPADHAFHRSGLAALSDLRRPEYERDYRIFEQLKSEFLKREQSSRTPDNRPPLDEQPFWSRIWEYPYVLHHLRELRAAFPADQTPKVADLGSGFTAFPFAVAQLGFDVACLDIDETCAREIERSARATEDHAGSVGFHLIEGERFPLESGELDALYCVSVLEHIPDFGATIDEVARVLKPGGTFALTIDLDCCGYMEIGVDVYDELRRQLEGRFTLCRPERSVHPLDVLQPRNGPVPYLTYGPLRRLAFHAKDALRALAGKSPRRSLPNLAVWGGVMRRDP